MKRRAFIQLSAIAATSLMVPTAAKAELATPPLYIHVHAGGGWDPTMFCDPKPALNRLSMSVKQVSGTPIQYASMTGGENIASFFETYGSKLLVINGINAQGVGHTSGIEYATNGKLSSSYPVLSALVTRIYNPRSSLGFIRRGNIYANGAGLSVGVDIPFLSTFRRILDPSLRLTNTGVAYKYMSDSSLSALRQTVKEGSDAKILSESSTVVKESMAHREALLEANKDLKKIIITDEMKANEGFFSDVAIAVDGYQKGLTNAIQLASGSYDTHNDHDADYLAQLNNTFSQLNQILPYIESRISDNYVLVVSSEFGRTPSYNSNNGKDHWTTTSWLFMGKGITGGRVIGETTDRHAFTTINPVTLERDDTSSVSITFGHIHIALRELLGISNNTLCSDIFQLDQELENLPLFS